jgi:large-conductance mechanosensitive channel
MKLLFSTIEIHLQPKSNNLLIQRNSKFPKIINNLFIMRELNYIITATLLFLVVSCSNGQLPPPQDKTGGTQTEYMQARAAFKTELTKKMKAP